MLRALTPIQARLLLLLVVLASLWSTAQAFAPAPPLAMAKNGYTDLQLYRDIADAVKAGAPYHQAARDLQHTHDFPTRPFVTIRMPTLAHMAAALGWPLLQGLLAAVLLLTIALWYRLTAARSSGAEPLGLAFAILLGGAMISQQGFIALHDLWAGTLTAAAMALRGGSRWPWAVALAALALFIRELALPFILLALVFAVVEKRRNEAIGWAALLGLFAMAMWLHAAAVHAVVLPTDKPSMPWSDMRGASAVLRDLSQVSLLSRLPPPLAFAAIPLALLGWAAAPRQTALFGLLYCTGMAAMIALFSRPDNFYWACLLLPAWFIGFAFLPRALRDLAQAALARRAAAL